MTRRPEDDLVGGAEHFWPDDSVEKVLTAQDPEGHLKVTEAC